MRDSGKRTRLLFVFHEAGRTGAAIVLFRYVQWLSRHADYELFFLLKARGALEKELQQLGTVFYWTPLPAPSRLSYYGNKLRQKIGLQASHQERVLRQLAGADIRLIYANTIVCYDLVAQLKTKLRARVIWHIHELALATQKLNLPVAGSIPSADHFVANSKHTGEFLQSEYGISPAAITVLYPPLPSRGAMPAAGARTLRTGKFIIGSAGTAMTQKGAELFVVLARLLQQLAPGNDLYFVWVGNTGKLGDELRYDVRKAGLAETLEFTGETPHPENYYREFDVFISLSKEESFGLACLEAAAEGKPVMGFSGTGLDELIRGCGGSLVSYLDLLAFAKQLLELRKNKEALQRIGETAADYAKQFTEEQLLPQWKQFLDNQLAHA